MGATTLSITTLSITTLGSTVTLRRLYVAIELCAVKLSVMILAAGYFDIFILSIVMLVW